MHHEHVAVKYWNKILSECFLQFAKFEDVGEGERGEDLQRVPTVVGVMCCSCAIMLLQQGANVTDEIVLYDPKLDLEKPAETKPAVPEKKEKPVLKWRPLQNLQLKKEQTEKKRKAHSIFQVSKWIFFWVSTVWP